MDAKLPGEEASLESGEKKFPAYELSFGAQARTKGPVSDNPNGSILLRIGGQLSVKMSRSHSPALGSILRKSHIRVPTSSPS